MAWLPGAVQVGARPSHRAPCAHGGTSNEGSSEVPGRARSTGRESLQKGLVVGQVFGGGNSPVRPVVDEGGGGDSRRQCPGSGSGSVDPRWAPTIFATRGGEGGGGGG
jgi:hypothetical protein